MNSQENEKYVCLCNEDINTNSIVVSGANVNDNTQANNYNSNVNRQTNTDLIAIDQVEIGTSPQTQMLSTVGTTTDNVPVTETANTGTETNPTSTNNTTNTQTAALPNTQQCANVVTIPVPIVQNEENYTYITIKGSLHDNSCAVFGLDEEEIQALSKRFENGVKPVVNGIMVSVPPMQMVNTMAQLSYKVICSCGEAEICWTMQREV